MFSNLSNMSKIVHIDKINQIYLRDIDEYIRLNQFETSAYILNSYLEFLRKEGEDTFSNHLRACIRYEESNWNQLTE